MIEENDGCGWNIWWLITCQLSAVVLYLSWLVGPFRTYWDQLDRAVFLILNTSLDAGRGWQLFWAVANNRLFDLVAGILMLTIFLRYIFAENQKFVQNRTAITIFILFYSLAATLILKSTVCNLDRLSPTLTIENSIRLSELFPSIPLKDASSVCFPGDHATVLFLFTAFIWYFGGKKYGIAGLFLSILFSLPRLVGGGHWLTDDLVGGGFMFLTIVGWALATPLHCRAICWIEDRLAPFWKNHQ